MHIYIKLQFGFRFPDVTFELSLNCGYWESGILGKWDFGNARFWESKILGKRDFGKV